MLREIAEPVVLETHGGAGKLYRACYASVLRGAVFEKNARKAELLAGQRPTWAVYEADCEAALADGACAWLPVTLLDVDPYGEPWPVLRAFFGSERVRSPTLWVVVNDGLRKTAQTGSAWRTRSLEDAVRHFGNNLWPIYLDVCRWLMERVAAPAGYAVRRFEGYYCGHVQSMTHYAALLEQG